MFDQIDEGDTDGLVDFIENTSSSSTIKNELLDVSPFLSDEVLITLIDKSGINQAHVKQVLEANAPLSKEVLLALIESPNDYPEPTIRKLILDSSPVADESVLVAAIDRVPELNSSFFQQVLIANSPLRDPTLLAMLTRTEPISNTVVRKVLEINTPLSPEVDAQFIANSYPSNVYTKVYGSGIVAGFPNDKVSPESVVGQILDEITYNEGKIISIVDRLVRFYLRINDYESAVLLLEAENTIQASCALLPILLETRDGVRLYNHILDIRAAAHGDPDIFALCDYYELMFEIRTQPGGIEAITPTQINELNIIANGNSAMVANNENILEFIGEREINELHMIAINFGPVTKAPLFGSGPDEVEQEETSSSEMLLYPNPADLSVTVRYSQPYSENNVNLYVYNLTGQALYNQELQQSSGEVTIDVSQFTPGIYMVVLVNDAGKMVEKLIVK
ncbi:T9SS type A sorting domain-containing protein [Crocinitomix catalasitica]|nr:T9SS type A sorting domain-containing protein [Crocinitomix catalasitica]